MAKFSLSIFIGLVACTIACKSEKTKESSKNSVQNTTKEIQVVKHVMTKAQQDSLTPDQVIQEFKEGNTRFNNG